MASFTPSFKPDPKPAPKVKKVKVRINPKSKKRIKDDKVYRTLRDVFLKDKICPITGQVATEVHHKKGRVGDLFLDIRYWLAVSRAGHIKIEADPEWAIKNGYSIKRIS